LGTLIDEGIKLRKRRNSGLLHFLLSLRHQNNRFENISVFIFAPIQLITPPPPAKKNP